LFIIIDRFLILDYLCRILFDLMWLCPLARRDGIDMNMVSFRVGNKVIRNGKSSHEEKGTEYHVPFLGLQFKVYNINIFFLYLLLASKILALKRVLVFKPRSKKQEEGGKEKHEKGQRQC